MTTNYGERMEITGGPNRSTWLMSIKVTKQMLRLKMLDLVDVKPKERRISQVKPFILPNTVLPCSTHPLSNPKTKDVVKT